MSVHVGYGVSQLQVPPGDRLNVESYEPQIEGI